LLASEFEQKRAQMQSEVVQLEQNGRRQQQKIDELLRAQRLLEEEKVDLGNRIEELETKLRERATDDYREKYEAVRSSNKGLKEQLATALRRIAFLGNGRTEAKAKVKEFRAEIEALQMAVEQLQREKDELTEQHHRIASAFDSAKQKIVQMTAAARESEQVLATQKRQIDRLKHAVDRCEAVLREQSVEIEASELAKANLIHIIRTQDTIELALTEVIEAQAKNVAARPADAQRDAVCGQVDQHIPIPISSIPGVPEDLAGVLDGIGENSHMRPEAKVRQIVRVVCEWYEHEITDRENKLKTSNLESKRVLEEIRRYFPDVGMDQLAETLVTVFKEQKQEIAELQAKLRTQEDLYTGLLLVLESSTAEEAQIHLSKLKQTNEAMTQRLAVLKRQWKSQRKAFESDRGLAASQLNSITAQLRQAQDRISELEVELTASAQNAIDSARMTQLEQTEIQLRSTLASFEAKLQEESRKSTTLQTEVETKADEVETLSKHLTLLKAQNRQQSQKLQKLRSEIADMATRPNAKEETEMIRASYERMVEDLRTRNTEFQREVISLNETVATLQDSIQTLRAANSDVSLETEQWKLKTAALERELDRAKKTTESEAQTLAFKHEFNLKNRVEECRTEFERSQRELIGFFALQFSSIVNLNERLTEASFRIVVQKLRAEFERLLAQDRNVRLLLSLGPKQSIEDAIARKLITFDS
jgi:chromosome segregation ATPase